MLTIKTLSIPAVLLITALGFSPAAAAGTNAESTQICTTAKRAVYRFAGHPSKAVKVPRRQYVESQSCAASGADALVMASYLDAPGGKSLVAGHADRAVNDIRRNSSTSTYEQINLCVALTVLREWDDARAACDAAVKAAKVDKIRTPVWPGVEQRHASERLAAAYSNRAVLHWLLDDAGAAHADLSKARASAPKASFVKRNLDLTVRVPAQIQRPVYASRAG